MSGRTWAELTPEERREHSRKNYEIVKRHMQDPDYARNFREKQKLQREKHKERIRQYQKEHRDQLLEYGRQWREKNREKIREQEKARWNSLPREIRAEKARARYEKVKQRMAKDPAYLARIRELQKQQRIRHSRRDAEYRRIHKEKLANSIRNWRKNNPDRIKAWQENNKDKILLYRKQNGAKRRARIGSDSMTSAELATVEQSLREWQLNLCFYCLRPLDKFHLDHVVPLARNGTHSSRNIVLSCPECNVRKADKLLLLEWVPEPVCTIPLVTTYPHCRVIPSFLLLDKPWSRQQEIDFRLPKNGTPLLLDIETRERTLLESRHAAPKERTAARHTVAVNVSSDQARKFMNTHHIQGFFPGEMYIGLELDHDLVGAASFRSHKEGLELKRLCFDRSIVGGLGKIMSFLRLTTDVPVVSWCNPRFHSGSVYPENGFVQDGSAQQAQYGYATYSGLLSRQKFQKHKLPQILDFFDPSLTEKENCAVNGLFQVHLIAQEKWISE